MVWELRLLGFPILYLRAGPELNPPGLAEWDGSSHTNGSFERDTEPLRADRMEPLEWEDRQIGFR